VSDRLLGNIRNIICDAMLLDLPFIVRVFKSHNLSVFFVPARYSVVKIARSSSEMVLRTIKHMVIYPGLGPSLEVIVLRPAV
jgi:hypothetical protein